MRDGRSLRYFELLINTKVTRSPSVTFGDSLRPRSRASLTPRFG